MTPDTISSLVNLGAAGAVIIVVWMFNKSNKERDKSWQDFFTELNRGNKEDLASLVGEFKSHAIETRDAITAMKERTRPLTTRRQPRPLAGQQKE